MRLTEEELKNIVTDRNKAVKVSEAEITYSIRSLLKQFNIFHWKVWQGMGSAPGVSDIIGIYEGIALFMEIKTPKGKLSNHQVAFLANVNLNGGLGVCLRSLDDAIELLSGLKKKKEISEIRERFKY